MRAGTATQVPTVKLLFYKNNIVNLEARSLAQNVILNFGAPETNIFCCAKLSKLLSERTHTLVPRVEK